MTYLGINDLLQRYSKEAGTCEFSRVDPYTNVSLVLFLHYLIVVRHGKITYLSVSVVTRKILPGIGLAIPGLKNLVECGM